LDYISSKNRLRTATILLFSLVVFGILGYMIIEGDNLLNALYMTIITISTVGFGEIHRLSITGKVFTIVLIIMSFSIYAYAVTVISAYFLEGQLYYLNTNIRSYL